MKKSFLYTALLDVFLGVANLFFAIQSFNEGRVGSAICSLIVGVLCFLFGANFFIKSRNERNPRT